VRHDCFNICKVKVYIVITMRKNYFRDTTYSLSKDIIYHFDKNEVLTNLRLTVDMDNPVPSISSIYFAALLIENEIQDQFDIKFEGLVLDFGRKLYLDDEITIVPMCNNTKAMKVNK